MPRILHWNGQDLPPELRDLPPGDFVIVPLDEALTTEAEDGLVDALAEIDRGEVRTAEDVRAELAALLDR